MTPVSGGAAGTLDALDAADTLDALDAADTADTLHVTTDASTTADTPVTTTTADRLDQLQAEHRERGVEIDESTAVTRWAGERMGYSTAIEWLLNRDGIEV